MGGSNDPDNPTDQDRAAIAEYETSFEGRLQGRQGRGETRAAALTKLFHKTPAMVEHRAVIDALTEADIDQDVTVAVTVPRRFLTMLEFREGQEAADAGRVPAPAAELLTRRLTNELEDELHWLTVAPARFEHYRNLWNRFCDEQGAPEEKIKPPAAAEGEDGESPF